MTKKLEIFHPIQDIEHQTFPLDELFAKIYPDSCCQIRV